MQRSGLAYEYASCTVSAFSLHAALLQSFPKMLPLSISRSCTPWRAPYCLQQLRLISEEQLNASQDHLQELFHRNMEKASRKRPEVPVRTTRREALSLYREVLRYSNLFVWKDAQGRMWRDVIRASTRKEFEDARLESDPEIINKLIITGRDAVQRTVESFMRKRSQIIQEEAAAQESALHSGPSNSQRPLH